MTARAMTDRPYLTDDYLAAVDSAASRGREVRALYPGQSITNGEEPPAPTSRFRVFTDTEIEAMPPLTWLVPGILPQGALAELHGVPGTGKSFVIFDLVMAVQTGGSWLGHPVPKGQVLYLAFEGHAGLQQRLQAWKAARGWDGRETGARFITDTVNMLQPADLTHLLLAARALPEPPTLVVIDTLAKSMPGGNENATEDMSLVIDHANRVRMETGATVQFVHHTRRDSEEERGSSALRGGVDTMMMLKKEDDRLSLICSKQKDAPEFMPIAFDLLPVLNSCVVQLRDGSANTAQEQTEKVTPNRRSALLALRDGFTDRGATTTEWLEASALPKRTFYNVRKWCVEQEHVTEKASGNGTRYTLTPSGSFIASDGWIQVQKNRLGAIGANAGANDARARSGGGAPPFGPPVRGAKATPHESGPISRGSDSAVGAKCQTDLALENGTSLDELEVRLEREAIEGEP